MVFQDPFASLNPRHSVGRIVGEPIRVHGLAGRREAGRRVRELLAIVGLPPDATSRYQRDFSLTYLFIAHDLAVVRHISDRIAVMYLGSIVEISPADELYDTPLHPYTISLLSAVPIPDPEVERRRETILLAGDLPSPANPPPACRFHTRCPYVQPTRCRDEVPPLRPLATGHVVACHWAEDIRAGKIEPKPVEPVVAAPLLERVGVYEPPPV
jgi:peptide/nickel transport system ATP-binding protein